MSIVGEERRVIVSLFGRVDVGRRASEYLMSKTLVQQNIKTPIETAIHVGKSRVQELGLHEETVLLKDRYFKSILLALGEPVFMVHF